MSKRPKQTNTLFNYFASPQGKVTPKKNLDNGVTKKSGEDTPSTSRGKEKIKRITEDSDSDEEMKQPMKRSRIALIDSESDSENESPNKKKCPKNTISKSCPSKKHRIKSKRESSEEESSQDEKPDSPKPSSSASALNFSRKSIMTSFEFKKSDKQPQVKEKTAKKSDKIRNKQNKDDSKWLHENLEFLKPDIIRDAQGRKLSDPEYDHRTLFVPEKFLSSLSPAMRQWWILKSQNMDSILFFKVGKFYELYHMDAVHGVQHMGLSFMKGEFAHSGFPETAYGKMATILIGKGFKVARVEQTETPEMMAERCKKKEKTTKFDKVVKREICQVTTKASCVFGPQLTRARAEVGEYLYAVAAKVNSDNTCRFGICFVETSIGLFQISEFDDDKHCSKLLALFAEYPPGLILTERAANYGIFKNFLNVHLKDIMQDTLASKSQFYTAAKTLEQLYSEGYFKDNKGKFTWPSVFKEIANECAPKPEYELALKSLGAIHWFLKHSQIDIHVFSMAQFGKYEPVDLKSSPDIKHIDRDYMVLDATAIEKLDLLGGKGTLQQTLGFCKTAFGKRLLPRWICRPLCRLEKIKLRQEAVKELFENPHKLDDCQKILCKLPDLERQVAKIHTYGNKLCSTNHPDGRAIFYEAKTYSKRKIMDLIRTLKGFETSQEIATIFEGCESRLLKKVTQFIPDGMNINLTETLNFFKKIGKLGSNAELTIGSGTISYLSVPNFIKFRAFNHQEAEKDGKIMPKKGVEADYDYVEAQIAEINQELDGYLKKQCKFFGCPVNYFGSDKKRFQIEVPENRCNRADEDYRLEGMKKGAKPCRRYSTSITREFLQRIQKVEAEKNKIILDLNRRVFEKFSQRYEQWQQVIHCLTILDVLCSFAEYARTYSGNICMPNVEPFITEPFIAIRNGKHPCVRNIEKFVPNDTFMGVENKAPLLLLTGPNMGGKSTLMRQVSILCIMAQMGSFVPATECSLSLVDRVFTRLGANDDIIKGQSTFFVELTEASIILKQASKQSLLIIDELGRGTSTHDGNAIASAYVEKLIEMKCRTLFSTHYHTLVDRFVNAEGVQFGHMACMVENDGDPTNESVTLLYKLADGRCPKSFGFNAAKMAGLPFQIVKRGREVAKQLEQEDLRRRAFVKIFIEGVSVQEVRRLMAELEF